MRRTPGKARRIKYPYLTRKKRSINFWDKMCWQHRMSQVVFGYEQWRWDESPPHHFHLVYELSLKTWLNSELSGEQRVTRLRIALMPLSLCIEFNSEMLTYQKHSVTRCWGSADSPCEYVAVYQKTMWGEKVKYEHRKGAECKKWTWLTACVLFLHAAAMQR